MSTLQGATGTVTFPYVLNFSDLRLYLYVSLFVALDVAVPWLCHIIHPLAGPTLLPMFFFVLLAGMTFGWRAGTLVGLLTPLISYTLSGMPIPQILPRIIIEGTFYGLAAGLLRGQFRLGVATSLIGALVVGRLAVFAGMVLILGVSDSAGLAWETAKQGWPGIALQVILLPLVIASLEKLWATRHNENR